MVLGYDVAAALPGLRAEAESLMVDTCRVTEPGEGPGTWNAGTGSYDPPAAVEVYEGKCRIRRPDPAPRDADAGEASWALDQYVVSVPVVGSEDIADGHTVEILTSVHDAAAVGLLLTVTGGHWQTHSTARRLACRVVTRDA